MIVQLPLARIRHSRTPIPRLCQGQKVQRIGLRRRRLVRCSAGGFDGVLRTSAPCDPVRIQRGQCRDSTRLDSMSEHRRERLAHGAVRRSQQLALQSRIAVSFGLVAAEDLEFVFPSSIHGDPIGKEHLSRLLHAAGIEPAAARNTALGELSMQLPAAVLSRLTGIRPRTATRWAAEAAGSGSRYAAALPRQS